MEVGGGCKIKQSGAAWILVNPVPGVSATVLLVQISLQRSRALTLHYTQSVLLSGLSREPLPIIEWRKCKIKQRCSDIFVEVLV